MPRTTRSRAAKARKRPIPAWRAAHARALDGADDFKAMGKSLLALARDLRGVYDLQCRPTPGSPPRAFSAQSLNECRIAHEQRRAEAFLARARATGKRWRDVPHFLSDSRSPTERVLKRNYLKLLGWHGFKGQVLEALCFLAALSRFESLGDRPTVDVFGENGPLPVYWANGKVFLWTRPTLVHSKSGLHAKPDLLCSSSQTLTGRQDLRWIVESKCHGQLTSGTLRAEFGKGVDLEVPAYTIVTFKRPSRAILRAAKALGIDIHVFPLATDERAEYLAGTRRLEEYLAESLALSRDDQRLARMVLATGAELSRKVLPSA